MLSDPFFLHSIVVTDLKEHIIRVKSDEEIVISGLGFISVTNDEVIKIYTIDNVSVFTRKKLI